MQIATSTSGLLLRPWRSEDRLSLVKHGDSYKVWRNLTDMFPRPYTLEEADRWVRFATSSVSGIHLAVSFEGEAIGGIGVIGKESNHRFTGKFGYWLGEEFWGRGFATSAAFAMVRYAFEERTFARLEAPVFAWNPASARVLEKVGFSLEGVHRRDIFKDGQFTDSLMYALIRGTEPTSN